MGLKPITPGLRRIKHDSAQPTKVEITVPPGDELEVSDEVLAQLEAASTHFVDPDTVEPPARQLVKNEHGEVVGWSDGSEFVAADAEAVGLPAAAPDNTVASEPAAPKKAKRTAKKAAPKAAE
jgi:hypothetical protein